MDYVVNLAAAVAVAAAVAAAVGVAGVAGTTLVVEVILRRIANHCPVGCMLASCSMNGSSDLLLDCGTLNYLVLVENHHQQIYFYHISQLFSTIIMFLH